VAATIAMVAITCGSVQEHAHGIGSDRDCSTYQLIESPPWLNLTTVEKSASPSFRTAGDEVAN